MPVLPVLNAKMQIHDNPTCSILSIQHYSVTLCEPPAAAAPLLQIVISTLILSLEQVEPAGHAHRRQAQLQQHNTTQRLHVSMQDIPGP
jgi:hypothetical protein